MKTKKSFSSLSLQKINLEAELIISSHLQDLDRISNDIKALEERLRMAGIPFTFTYIVSSDQNRYRRIAYETITPYHERPYTAEFIKHIDTCLVWGKGKDGDCRLIHNIYNTENEMEEYNGEDGKVYERVLRKGKPSLFYSKPLIETKSHCRVGIEKELLSFYKSIIEALKTKRDKECIFEYSPNYNLPLHVAMIDSNPILF